MFCCVKIMNLIHLHQLQRKVKWWRAAWHQNVRERLIIFKSPQKSSSLSVCDLASFPGKLLEILSDVLPPKSPHSGVLVFRGFGPLYETRATLSMSCPLKCGPLCWWERELENGTEWLRSLALSLWRWFSLSVVCRKMVQQILKEEAATKFVFTHFWWK